MANTISLMHRSALGRQATGERKRHRIPGVLYGHGILSTPISMQQSDILSLLRSSGRSGLKEARLDQDTPVKVLVKEIQTDPISGNVIHIDLYQVNMQEVLSTTVPCVFIGDSPAVKVEGGTLVKSLDRLEIRCLPAHLPQAIDIDLKLLQTCEDAISAGMIVLPNGVELVTDSSVIIATVARAMTEDELKRLEGGESIDLAAIKTEGEEKKAAEVAKKAEEGEIAS